MSGERIRKGPAPERTPSSRLHNVSTNPQESGQIGSNDVERGIVAKPLRIKHLRPEVVRRQPLAI